MEWCDSNVVLVVQLIEVQKKLRQEGELIDSLAKLSKLREQGGDKGGKSSGGSGGGGGGLKNTLKKMKPAGKKKRQRNITAPELSAEALKGLRKEPVAAAKTSKEGTGRGLFGKKQQTKSEKEGGSPEKKRKETEVGRDGGGIREEEEGNVQDPFSGGEDGVLSQRSDTRVSDYALSSHDLPPATIPHMLTHSKTDSALNYQPDLSQLSLSSSIPEEAGSTQSSFEAVPLDNLAPPSRGHPEADSGGGGSQEDPPGGGGEGGSQEGSPGGGGREGEERDFRKGCPELYDDYGDEQHKLNLKHVLKFLDTCSESQPADLSSLVDWEGWTMASKEVM